MAMPGTLLSQLEALANAATDEIARATFRAQWAGAMARLGRVEAARTEIAKLRAINAAYTPQLTAWIWMAEGLADHFESLSVNALDRFRRAYGIAVSFNDVELSCFASAWIGASEFLAGEYENATKHSLIAIERRSEAGALALSRAHLVLANVFSAIGALPAASVQYAKARHFAVEARDISMQSAVLYNVAAFRIARISLIDAFGTNVTREAVDAELELNSITNLDLGIGVQSLSAMVPILRAQLELVKRQWADADEHYTNSLPKAATYGQLRWEPRFLAEQAHCKVMLGQHERATDLASGAVTQVSTRLDLDDLAACHARLALTYSALERGDDARRHLAEARHYSDQFAARQDLQREKISRLVSLE